MNATLSFNLPEESLDHLDAINGTTYKVCLSELDAHLRGLQKYDHPYKTPDEVIDAIRSKLHEIVGDFNLTLD